MDYNTQRPQLVIREYGRNIQNLINHAITIEDDALRLHVAEGIVSIMAQLTPQIKNIEDHKAKLWHHLQLISKDKMNITYPFEMPEDDVPPIEKLEVEYPKNNIRFRHYGQNVATMIAKAVEMEDEEKKKAYTLIIANYMKMVLRNWSGENVSDDVVFNDIVELSKGKLKLDESTTLNKFDHIPSGGGSSYKKKKRSNNNGYKSKNYKSNSRNNNKYKKRNYR